MDSDDDYDEQQDWSLITSLKPDEQFLPKRGEKDFEPDGTGTQVQILADSRNAMYSALQGKRSHGIKNHVSAEWIPRARKAKLMSQKGSQFYTMGKADSQGAIWLQPEETLYLVERGTMSLYYRGSILLSLQAAYSMLLCEPGDLERYQVYSTLRISGFAVMRSEEADPNYEIADKQPKTYLPQRTAYSISTAITRLGICLFETIYYTHVLGSKHYTFRSYNQVYKHIAYNENRHPTSETKQPEFPYRVQFDVWKPDRRFRKSNPGKPDYRLAIVSARDFHIPTFQQTASMFMSAPANEEALKYAGNKYLKEGWRNLILAVVDSGVISFSKLSDVNFVQEKLYAKTKTKSKSKGKTFKPGKSAN